MVFLASSANATGGHLTKFAEATNTPVFYSNKYSSPVPTDHELRGGPATRLAAFAGGDFQPDFILLLGARTGFLLGGRSGAIIPNQNCTVAQVDLDGSEIGKSHSIEIGIVSDAALFCEAVLDKASKASIKRNDEWIKACHDDKASLSPYDKHDDMMPDGQMHPYKVRSI